MNLSQVYTRIEENKARLSPMSTGFEKLNRVLHGGFLRRELVVIGADTGQGKSYFAGQLLRQVAQQGIKTGYYSLEITNEMIVTRMIGSMANIHPMRITLGQIKEEEQIRYVREKARLEGYSEYMDFYDDKYAMVDLVKSIQENEYGLVVIDFVQNILGEKKGLERHEALTDISLYLQKLAKEKNVCIVLLSQLSNSVARDKGNTRPEYKGSGGIAQVADLGIMLERVDPDEIDETGLITLRIVKNRRGVTGVSFSYHVVGEGGCLVEA